MFFMFPFSPLIYIYSYIYILFSFINIYIYMRVACFVLDVSTFQNNMVILLQHS